jgi:hypothetical protein
MVKKSCSPKDYPQFGALPEKIVQQKAASLADWIWGGSKNIPADRIEWYDSCVVKIIDLVERRRVYFHVYHERDMSEWNEVALYCFWIVKLQPFYEIKSKSRAAMEANETNARIAARMLYGMANRIRHKLGRNRITWPNIKNTIHAFRYRDISKESIMALLEALIEK